MDSERKAAARDKLVSKAQNWAWRKRGKIGLTGADLKYAQAKFRESECELAEAVEKFEKER